MLRKKLIRLLQAKTISLLIYLVTVVFSECTDPYPEKQKSLTRTVRESNGDFDYDLVLITRAYT